MATTSGWEAQRRTESSSRRDRQNRQSAQAPSQPTVACWCHFHPQTSASRKIIRTPEPSNKKGVISTKASHVVPHRSTDFAQRSLTSEIGRDPVDRKSTRLNSSH